ncbi:MAG: NUDIX hydrolase [Micrococcales bacterium]|nr:NUDIX hydrolase [Micrococcales bacterium]
MASVIPAAGTLPWRRRDGTLEVALVHRPKYDDWSWPKGKLDPGEHAHVTAVRETAEETGLHVHLGIPLPSTAYPILDPRGEPARKQVHYWAATVAGGSGVLEHEIDEVAWVDVRAASDRLDYTRDREQLLALVRADRAGALETWPLALVRHAKAHSRSSWKGKDDRRRPLDRIGKAQAEVIAAILCGFGVSRLVSSSSVRCTKTLAPYADRARLRLHTRDGLTEECFAETPQKAVRHLAKLLDRGESAALCSHGPVLPSLIDTLAGHVMDGHPGAAWLSEELATAADSGMCKGEVLVSHVTGRGPSARIVAVERIDT